MGAPHIYRESRRPKAVVEKIGRFSYRVYITDGIVIFGLDGWGWIRYTEKSAIKKAQRELDKYNRDKDRKKIIVTDQPREEVI